jgi:hypothetical protein
MLKADGADDDPDGAPTPRADQAAEEREVSPSQDAGETPLGFPDPELSDLDWAFLSQVMTAQAPPAVATPPAGSDDGVPDTWNK